MDAGHHSEVHPPRGPVGDRCASSFSVAKARMLLPQHMRFVGYMDLKRVTLSLLQLVLIFAHQVLDEEMDTTGDDNVLQAGFKFVKFMRKRDAKRGIEV